MIVAGLDMATMTGVCIGRAGDVPAFFSRDLGVGKPHDYRFDSALKLGLELIKEQGAEAIGIEAPIILGHDKKANNQLLMGIVACVRGWSHVKGIPCQVFEIKTIDKHFLGQASRGGRDARKAAIKNQCRILGWSPNTDDEADAGAVWDIMCAHMSPAYGASTGQLLRGRV